MKYLYKFIKALIRSFRRSRVLALGLLTLLLILRAGDPSPIETARLKSFDLFQQLKPRTYTQLPVAIIDIDDPSLTEIGQWPWPRTIIADVIHKAAEQGAVAIGFDMIFSEPDRLSPALVATDNPNLPNEIRDALAALPSNEDVLSRAISSARVVVGQTSIRSSVFNQDEKASVIPVPHAFLGLDPDPYLQKFPDILQNLPQLEEHASGFGVFTVRPDVDGVFRRVPLVMKVQGAVRLGLAPELLRIATGGDAFAIRSNEAGIEGLVVARQLVTTDADGSVWPHFSPSQRGRYVSAADLLNDRLPDGRLAGHLVLVGTSAIGLEDFRATPLGTRMAGVEIHAQVLENILTQTLLLRPNYAIGAELVLTVVLGLIAIALTPALGARWAIICSGVLLTGVAYGAWWAFDTHQLLLDPSFPLLATAVIVLALILANYLREERQRQEIRTAFGQYVSPDLVEQLSNEPGALALGGETKELTLLFSDVRGFTTISESYKSDPQGLTRLMNQFLTVLSNAILSQNGTIDKFMGDAVMAFWNAPLDIKDHARSACIAALEMQKETKLLNEANGDSVPSIDVGIGVNSGTCVVGNMGTDARFDYSALGDPVNLAARLEGQSKTYSVGIVIGNATASAVETSFALLELDLIRVKGKSEPERIFGLFGDETVANDPEFKSVAGANQAMLEAYRSRDWATAAARAEELSRSDFAQPLTGYASLWQDRIRQAQENPPGADWDGVYTATSK